MLVASNKFILFTAAKKSQKNSNQEVTPIKPSKGGKYFAGRMKDKRKIRQLIEKSEENHADDAFDSTPIKNKLNTLNVSISDDEESNTKYFSKDVMESPVNTITPTKTSGIFSPVNRDATDTYIRQILTRRSNKATGVLTMELPKLTKKAKSKESEETSIAIQNLTQTVEEGDSDEQDTDFYFSDSN